MSAYQCPVCGAGDPTAYLRCNDPACPDGRDPRPSQRARIAELEAERDSLVKAWEHERGALARENARLRALLETAEGLLTITRQWLDKRGNQLGPQDPLGHDLKEAALCLASQIPALSAIRAESEKGDDGREAGETPS